LTILLITWLSTAGVFEPRDNLEEYNRTALLVTRVLIAPLYTVIGLNLYAAVALVMAAVALGSNSSEVTEARSMLSIWGIVAHSFEFAAGRRRITRVEDLFLERHNKLTMLEMIGVEKVEGSTRLTFRLKDAGENDSE
jgi:hypothetical protein